MDNQTENPLHSREGDAFRQALVQVHAAALQGLAQANDELARADEAEEWENWSLWRGYRRAMLEVLAITDRIPLAEFAPPPTAEDRPKAKPLSEGEGGQEVRPA
jgi:hypothetical protein